MPNPKLQRSQDPKKLFPRVSNQIKYWRTAANKSSRWGSRSKAVHKKAQEVILLYARSGKLPTGFSGSADCWGLNRHMGRERIAKQLATRMLRLLLAIDRAQKQDRDLLLEVLTDNLHIWLKPVPRRAPRRPPHK